MHFHVVYINYVVSVKLLSSGVGTVGRESLLIVTLM